MKKVLVRGCFDIFHVGHVRHLEQAKAMGDFLIVSLTQDCHVNKGPERPVFPLDLRRAVVKALRCVDLVATGVGDTAERDILFYQPDLFVKGPECRINRTPGFLKEVETILSIGGQIAYTDGEIHSSSELLKKVLSYG